MNAQLICWIIAGVIVTAWAVIRGNKVERKNKKSGNVNY
jgi:hypothetical protein